MKGSLQASFHCAQAAKQLVTPMAVAFTGAGIVLFNNVKYGKIVA